METQLTKRYAANLHGVRSCYEGILIVGTVPGTRYADGMTRFLSDRDIRIFKHHCKVEHRDWHSARELASLKQSTFNPSEQTLLKASQHGEFHTHGCRRRADLARHVLATSSALSRQLTRLRMLGLIKKRCIPIAKT